MNPKPSQFWCAKQDQSITVVVDSVDRDGIVWYRGVQYRRVKSAGYNSSMELEDFLFEFVPVV